MFYRLISSNNDKRSINDHKIRNQKNKSIMHISSGVQIIHDINQKILTNKKIWTNNFFFVLE